MMVTAGQRYGRWEVIRVIAPGRYSDNKRRARCVARCTGCTREKVLWCRDLVLLRSRGCPSKQCLARARAAAIETLGLDRRTLASLHREAKRRRITVGRLARERLEADPPRPVESPESERDGR